MAALEKAEEGLSDDIGNRLRMVRQIYGLTQRELARRAGVTNGAISLIEQNRVSPSISSLKKILTGFRSRSPISSRSTSRLRKTSSSRPMN